MKILTDYFILKSQCPLWEQNTHNVRNLDRLKPELMRSGLVPWGRQGFFLSILDSPLLTALKLHRHKDDYDLVVTGDTWVGLCYAFLSKLSFSHKTPHLQIDFLLNQPESGAFWPIKRRLFGYILSGIDRILVYSQSELKDYSRFLDVAPEKFKVVSYHTNIVDPQLISSNKGYLFSAGRSGRDYKTLLEAVRGMDVQLALVSDRDSLQGMEIPSNVTVYYDVSYNHYLELLKESKIVLIPLQPQIRSLGKVVMLEAMALGKPVIASRSVSIVEYIREGENGFLLEHGDVQGMREKITYLLNNSGECDRIARNALQDVLSYWTFEKYVQSVLGISEEMISRKRAKCRD